MIFILSLLLTVVILRIVGAAAVSLEIAGWGPAFMAAVVMTVFDSLVFWALPSDIWREPPSFMPSLASVWLYPGVLFILNVVSLALASLLVPGVTLRGIGGLFIASALITALAFGVPTLLVQAGGLL